MYWVKCQWQAESWFIFFSFQLGIGIAVGMCDKCKSNPDRFCYIYGNMIVSKRQAKITDFVKKTYRD